MENRLGKVGAIMFSIALFLEGCTPVVNQTPKPTFRPETPTPSLNSSPSPEETEVDSVAVADVLVDCETNPLDASKEISSYILRPGDSVSLIAITLSGEQDSATFYSAAPGVMAMGEDTTKFHRSIITNTNALFQDENVLFKAGWEKSGTETILKATATCADALPQ
jgi:hypothetical protein